MPVQRARCWASIPIIVAVLFAVAGCNVLTGVSGGANWRVANGDGAGATAGSLRVSVHTATDDAQFRTQARIADVGHITIEVRPDAASLAPDRIATGSLSAGATAVTFAGLPPGLTTISAHAYSRAQEVIGEGTATASILPGQTVQAAITIQLVPTFIETGTVEIPISVVDGPVVLVTPSPQQTPKPGAGSTVKGVLSGDTTWNLAGSPYRVAGDVQIPRGVTLTIEPGVVVKYAGAHEILTKGAVAAVGTADRPILFTTATPGISSGATILKFKGTDLAKSRLRHVKMEYAAASIQIGQETEHKQGDKNTGTLEGSDVEIVAAPVVTQGYDTGAKLRLSNVAISSTTIVGRYPRTEPIEIEGGTIGNTTIHSDSYNKGISIRNAVIDNCPLLLGCCGANFQIEDSILRSSKTQEGGGSPVSGPFQVVRSILEDSPVDLPAATVALSEATVSYSAGTGIRFGNGSIAASRVSGAGAGVGIEITGLSGYNVGGDVSISSSTIEDAEVGIRIAGANTVSLSKCNLLRNASYALVNRSTKAIAATGNYWGTASRKSVADLVFDYFDDINFGQVDVAGFLSSPAPAAAAP